MSPLVSSVCHTMSALGATQEGAEVAQLDCRTVPLAQSVNSVSFPLPLLYVVFHAPFHVRSCPSTSNLFVLSVL